MHRPHDPAIWLCGRAAAAAARCRIHGRPRTPASAGMQVSCIFANFLPPPHAHAHRRRIHVHRSQAGRHPRSQAGAAAPIFHADDCGVHRAVAGAGAERLSGVCPCVRHGAAGSQRAHAQHLRNRRRTDVPPRQHVLRRRSVCRRFSRQQPRAPALAELHRRPGGWSGAANCVLRAVPRAAMHPLGHSRAFGCRGRWRRRLLH